MITTHYLKPLALSILATVALLHLMYSLPALAGSEIIYQPSPDSPIGERNPNGPAELAQYDFLIGDWDVDMTWYFDGKPPTKSVAKWHNHWIINGNVVMLEWRGTDYTGAEIRQWDKNQNKWTGVNIYPDFSHAPKAITAEKNGDTMQVFIPVEGKNGPFINRETYYDITPDRYKMRSENSFDGGETWQRGLYEMTVTRTRN
jgi:hypothetical protein